MKEIYLFMFLPFIIPAETYGIISSTIQLLEYGNNIKFKNIIVMYDADRNFFKTDSLRDIIYQKLFVTDDSFLSSIAIEKINSTNLSGELEKRLADIGNIVFVVLDFSTSNRVRQAVYDLPADYFTSTALLLINPYDDTKEEDKKNFVNSLEYYYNEKTRIDSQIYVLTGNLTKATVLEVYKICKDAKLTIREVGKTGYGADLALNAKKSMWERRHDLMGCLLNVAYVDSFPLVTLARNEDELVDIRPRFILRSGNISMYGGKVNQIELMNLLVSDLNFTISWINALGNTYGVYDTNTNTWNGLIGILARDEADFALNYLTVTLSRSVAISFTIGFETMRFGMFMARPRASPSWVTFVEVFDSKFWNFLLGMIGMLSFALSLFYIKCHREGSSRLAFYLTNLTSSASVVFLGLAEYDNFTAKVKKLYVSNSFKLLMLVICVFGFLIKEAYNGALISSLVDPRYESDINVLEDVLTHPGYQLILRKGTAIVNDFSSSTEWPLKQIWKTQLRNNTAAYVNGLEEAENLLLNDKKYVYFDLINQVEPSFEGYPCNIIRSRKTYFPAPVALGFPKKSQYLGLFNYKLQTYRQTGIIENMESFKKNSKEHITCASDPNHSIGFYRIFFAFVALGIGLVIAVSFLMIELFLIKYKLGLCVRALE